MADELLIPSDPNGATVVWLHGGALMAGSPADHQRHGVLRYAAAGYRVICLDYPLYPEASLDQIVSFTIEACSRVEPPYALVGHSAGAYLALTAAVEVDRKPAAIVSFYGYGSLRWGLEPAYLHLPPADREQGGAQLYLWCRQHGRWLQEVTGKDRVNDSECIDHYEPIRRPEAGVPTLLLHGDADIDVPVDESRRMAAAFARAGTDHAYVEVPGAGHGFDGDAVYLGTTPDIPFERALRFLEERLL
jgi:acetyl esterase/lipase